MLKTIGDKVHTSLLTAEGRVGLYYCCSFTFCVCKSVHVIFAKSRHFDFLITPVKDNIFSTYS